MAKDFAVGCTYNFLQPYEEVPPLRRFEMVRDTGAFDYINWLPPSRILSECARASDKTGIPMTTGNCGHQLGNDDPKLAQNVRDAATVGMQLLNVMLNTYAADGHELTDQEIVDTYCRTAELGQSLGVAVSFELHVDCWSEKYKRVRPIIEAVRQRGVAFNLTLDYSHVIFKIDNPEQQDISDVREDVGAGRIILDPFEPGSILSEWLGLDVIGFAQFRPVAPHNPRNIWAKNPDGSLPRGIMYPFLKPGPGEWHSQWHAYMLATCKEAFRVVFRHHLTHASSPLKYVITEMIARADYGLNAKFSLLEHNAACARWIRSTWSQLKAMHAAGIPLDA
jgi:hypothetical protein